jgi:hypothetical protein
MAFMKRTALLLSGCTLCAVIFLSCNKTVGKPDPCSIGCDTITYKKHVEPIFIASCAKSGCHDAGTRSGGVELPAMAKKLADEKRIEARVIKGDPTFMPSDLGKLPCPQYNIVKCWLDNGAPEN